MKRIIASVLIIMIMLSMAGCCLKHEWLPATCTVPQTCAKCGETVGVPLQHIWLPATCTAPKTCSVCGETEGELGHSWVAATCTQPKTCSLCGATKGNPAPHHFGDYETIKEPSVIAEGEKQRVCADCGFIEKTSIPKHDLEEALKNKAESYASSVVKGVFRLNSKVSCKSCSAETSTINESRDGYICRGNVKVKDSNSKSHNYKYSVTIEVDSNGSLSIVDYDIGGIRK